VLVEDLIRQFVQAQNYVLQQLHLHFQVDPYITAMEWAFLRQSLLARQRQHPVAQIFSPHGFGLEFKDEQVHIDFDFSRSGRPNGFDGWRLYLFAEQNHLTCEYATAKQVEDALEQRYAKGLLDRELTLYFLRA
jgi:hypothetical protein